MIPQYGWIWITQADNGTSKNVSIFINSETCPFTFDINDCNKREYAVVSVRTKSAQYLVK